MNTDHQGSDAECVAKRWRRRTLWLLFGLCVFRLAYICIAPLDLVHDEAYYWDWSRQLDWGYYSKPPLIAWLIAGSTWISGSYAFAVRMPAVLLSVGGLGFVYLLAARLYSARVGFWATLLSAAMPGNAVLGMLMTIDAPFLFFWCAALYAVWRMFENAETRYRWLVLSIVVTGLGLLSKQTMLGFLPLTALFLLASPDRRRMLVGFRFWTWCFGSLAFLAPVALWNAQHGWVTVQHTGQHFASETNSIAVRLSEFGEFLVTQWGVASPVICWLWAIAVLVAIWCFPKLSGQDRYLLCFSGIPMIGVLCLSLTQRIEPNWPAAFYPSGIVFLAAVCAGHLRAIHVPRLGPGWMRVAAVTGLIMVGVVYLLPFGFGLEGSKLDPAVRLRGWKRLGEAVGERYSSFPRRSETFVMVTSGRAVASELAFYMPDQPRVYLWNDSGAVSSQYDIWGGPAQHLTWDAMIVTGQHDEPPQRLAEQFYRVEPVGDVAVAIGHGRAHEFRLWRGIGFRGTLTSRTSQMEPPDARKLR